MNHRSLLTLAIVATWLCSSEALAWLRPTFEAATVVERSELIVVGNLVKGSVVYVPHPKKNPDDGSSWEHHARLAVTEIVKGQCKEKELPIIIHYGLDPYVGGYRLNQDGKPDAQRGQTQSGPDEIKILDTGNSALSFAPLVKDAAKDNLWFLRRLSGTYGREPGTGDYGIADPEDLKPLAKKDYILAYLAADPVAATKKYAADHPQLKEQVERYADHVEVQRILKIEDPSARFDGLLPYYLKNTAWGNMAEARDGIVASGKVAGAKFLGLFDDPKCESHRRDIVTIWGRIGYREAIPVAVPFLVDILKREDPFWATQTLQPGWWNDRTESDLSQKRRNSYSDIYYAVCRLGEFKDPGGREALELSLKRWKAFSAEPQKQIVEACEEALRKIPPADNAPAK